jgi:hypothetical protein|tara:strand:+ start:101 stop:226 length:126 start_codon:yes stop_codon:yes gene_type:complete
MEIFLVGLFIYRDVIYLENAGAVSGVAEDHTGIGLAEKGVE